MTTNPTHPVIPAQPVPPAEVANARSQRPGVGLIDVRTPVEYAEVHAEGAKLVPLDVLDPEAVMADRNGSAGEPVYVLCKSGTRAAKAVERFRAAGFDNVFGVEGGTQAWERAGLPVVRGKKVMSLERQVRVGAGSLVLLGVLLGWLVHPAFFGLSAFVGAGLVFAGLTDWCGMGMVLARMPWNRRA
ncbi:MAG: rhodanese-like domain-containing protein [Phycisphaerae bacterium]|nr:rhodanese-like domain-containing protein [Tepidisphaeraceae bacterium]